MKQLDAYKKQLSNYLYLGIIFLILCFFFIPLFSFGQSKEELEQKINNTNSDILQIEKEIANYQKQLNSLGKEKTTLNNSIKEIDLNRQKLNKNISLTESKITKTNLRIQSLGGEIDIKEKSIDENVESVKNSLRRVNKMEKENLVFLLLQGSQISEIWADIDQMLFFKEKLRDKIDQLEEVKGDLLYSQSEEKNAKSELLDLKSELSDEKKIVEQNKKEKENLLKQTKNSEANYQKLLKENNARKDALEKEIEAYESQLKFILDPNSLPGAGVLSWPLDEVYVTQLFGKTKDSVRLYASGSHSGVDFRASTGTPVKAVADGVIEGVGDTDTTCPKASFGKWIFIDHNNGLATTYGHLSLIKVSSGQKVTRGQIIGYSGNTGHTTGPHLHLTVYASASASVKTKPSRSCPGKILTQPMAATNAYLDPITYLPVYK